MSYINARTYSATTQVVSDAIDRSVTETDWTAYRYPTEEEIAAGRGEDDMVRVACAPTASEAADLLRLAVPAPLGTCIGQVQHGADGAVEIVEAR